MRLCEFNVVLINFANLVVHFMCIIIIPFIKILYDVGRDRAKIVWKNPQFTRNYFFFFFFFSNKHRCIWVKPNCLLIPDANFVLIIKELVTSTILSHDIKYPTVGCHTNMIERNLKIICCQNTNLTNPG